MAFKFPFTNYHELNLTWVLDQLKKLFEESAENVTVIENYNGRLTAVETELPAVSENAAEAARSAAAAATLAQTAKQTADTAQENAIQAQRAAGTAQNTAERAQEAADAATQAAQQAQATAQNFDGRITQAENDASQALEASRSFENRVQSAITTANNAAQTATNAQGIATRADQNAALALDTLNSQRAELERIGAEQAALITNETESGKTEIENLAQSVLDSIPADYTELSELVDKKAPVIINSASGSIASFDDGADNMKIQKLVVNIEPLQAGSGDPSPNNIRPISGWTGAEIEQRGKNLFSYGLKWYNGYYLNSPVGQFEERPFSQCNGWQCVKIPVKVGDAITISGAQGRGGVNCAFIGDGGFDDIISFFASLSMNGTFTVPAGAKYVVLVMYNVAVDYVNFPNAQVEISSTATAYEPYTGNQISVTFPDEAGTIYGGTIVLNPDRTGTLVVDRYGETTANMTPNAFYNNAAGEGSSMGFGLSRSSIPGNISEIVSLPCNMLSTPGTRYFATNRTNAIAQGVQYALGVNGAIIRIYDESNTITREEFISKYADCMFVYPLASPQTYQLTAEQVSGILTTLYGTNNIWADTGDVSVDYPADTKLYIDAKLAELQATILENI